MTRPAAALTAAVGDDLGSPVRTSSVVSGGDVAASYRMVLDDDRAGFVKTVVGAPAGMSAAEAAGLAWLAETGTVRVPRVLAVRDEPDPEPRYLVLEWIETNRPAVDHDERLGRALAHLHGAPCAGFGLAQDNWLATLPQDNRAEDSWAEFYRARRIEPLVRRGLETGDLPATARALVDRLESRLADLVGPDVEPSRLHGDLWGGNAIVDAAGHPVLVDPAAYGGDAEVDLAMMRLFGGFSPTVFAAYDEVRPPRPGRDERVRLYQLYPLLAHVALFGAGYADSVMDVLRTYG